MGVRWDDSLHILVGNQLNHWWELIPSSYYLYHLLDTVNINCFPHSTVKSCKVTLLIRYNGYTSRLAHKYNNCYLYIIHAHILPKSFTHVHANNLS